jgi:hypothetical protein
MGAGNMALAIKALAFCVVHKVVATIENYPRRIVEMLGQGRGVYQHGK